MLPVVWANSSIRQPVLNSSRSSFWILRDIVKVADAAGFRPRQEEPHRMEVCAAGVIIGDGSEEEFARGEFRILAGTAQYRRHGGEKPGGKIPQRGGESRGQEFGGHG